jgi:hypothetical protein
MRAGGNLVNCSCYQLLPRAALSGNQDRCISAAHLLQRLVHFLHSRTRANHLVLPDIFLLQHLSMRSQGYLAVRVSERH